ncbi:hypothetical protein Pcinc_022364 [Petrolisthes cinctipes]|uniref:Uncharacterized protein n=1 Tax=Petrolisthes cinctipes TaxID=88211 RepID=A0AAE1FEA8_PETCI|nr:hypothetical protein Pcinc_022364 [Petrolisthes cinctipes]
MGVGEIPQSSLVPSFCHIDIQDTTLLYSQTRYEIIQRTAGYSEILLSDLETCHKFESGIQNGNAELQSESVLPSVPQSGSFMVVVEGEAAHIERTRRLDTKLLEKKIEAEEKRIEAEKRRIEAYIAQKKYYTQLLLIDSKKNNKV